ncbi:MAG: CotH kinase family protein [Bacteroidia bacterium]|nr:CotH kinase family protein [Bacteroidia bacterium]
MIQKITKILISGIILLSTFSAYSQVVINEFSCSNISTLTDNYNEYEDWIELYNSGGAAVDITGYYMSDNIGNPDKWMVPSGNIPAGGYIIIYCSGRDEVSGGKIHAGFRLTQSESEYIVLTAPDGTTIIDSYWIQKTTQTNHSRGRKTDGAAQWGVFTTPTPGAANNNAKDEYASKPVFNIAPGFYGAPQNITLTTTEPVITIRYTTNGNEPTAASTQYTAPIAVNTTTVIRAKAFSSDTDILPSLIETNTYFINETYTLPVYSISGDEVDNLLNGNSGLEPEGAFEYFDANQAFVEDATGDFNKHGNDSWAYDQRGFDFIARDQYGVNNAIHQQVFRIKDRDEFQRLIFKAAANDNYPFEDGAHIRDAYVHSLSQIGDLKMDERSFEPCIVFMNGQYWGVYDAREKVDDSDFTDYYYDQGKYDLQFLKTWGGTWPEYGGVQAENDWDALKTFILSNDMSVPANFNYVDSLYNWQSLVDYVVLNSYVVCSDWLNWNTGWWRGMNPDGDKKKWRYILWDEDATFGHYINYTGIPDDSPNADPCNAEQLDDPGNPGCQGDPGCQGHIPILNALMDNATFQQYYVSRYADLSNTVFSCPFMQAHLDSLIAIIDPEMPAHIAKWGGTYAGWQANVQELRDFIDARCFAIDDGMVDCYNLTGPYPVTVLVEPVLSGSVDLNSLTLTDFPWTGNYYGNIEILLDADAYPTYVFDYWELVNHTVSPADDVENVVLNITTWDTIIAHFKNVIDLELGNDTTLCQGESLLLDAGDSATTYVWQNGSTAQTFLVTGPGTYSVTVTLAGNIYSDNIVVTYISPPSVFLGNDITLCTGNTLLLNAGNPQCGYLWQNGTTFQTYNVTQAGTYYVVVTNECGSDTDSITVGYSPPPTVALGDDVTICGGQTYWIDAGNPGMTYYWQNGTTNQTFPATQDGIYSVTVTNNYGCTGTDQVSVSVIETINADAGPNQYICKGQSVILLGSGGTSYLWSPAESLSDPQSPTPVATPETTTTYYVTVTEIAGCSATDAVTIFVYSEVEIALSANDDIVCPGDEVLIYINPSGGTGGPYTIRDEDNQLINPPVVIKPYQTVYYKVSAEDDCQYKIYDSIYITVLPKPPVNVYFDHYAGCEPLTVKFNEVTPDNSRTFLWIFNEGNGEVSQLRSPEYTFDNSGIYEVALVVTDDNGCDSTYTIQPGINVYTTPVALFAAEPDDATIIKPVIDFNNYSVDNDYSIWDFGDGTQSDDIEPVHEYQAIDTFTVQLIVRTFKGCSDTATGTVIIDDAYTFYAPDAFVPENAVNERNTRFYISANGIDSRHFKMEIYDRWGELVYSTYRYNTANPFDSGWDGRLQNGQKIAKAGVYTWFIDYRDTKSRQHTRSGIVTLIR